MTVVTVMTVMPAFCEAQLSLEGLQSKVLSKVQDMQRVDSLWRTYDGLSAAASGSGGAKWVMLCCLLVFNDSDELIAFC